MDVTDARTAEERLLRDAIAHGEAGVAVPRDAKAVSAAVAALLADAPRAAAMAAAGQARMGKAGASAAIAARLLTLLEQAQTP